MKIRLKNVDASPIVVYVLVFSVFFSPYFTPPATIGSNGILRLDQVLLPVLVIVVLLYTYPEIRFTKDKAGILIGIITISVPASLLYGTVVLGHSVRLGDFFNIIIWVSYAIVFLVVASTISGDAIDKSVTVIALGTIYVSLLGLLQVFDIWFSIEILDTVYGPGKYEGSGRVDSIEINPNVFGQLLVLPALIFITYVVRDTITVLSTDVEVKQLGVPFLLAFTAVFLSLINIYHTYSRTALVVLVLGIGIVGLFVLGFSPVSNRTKIQVVAASVVVAIAVIGLVGVQGGLWRYAGLLDIAGDSSFQVRYERWVNSIPVILESPIIGHGPTQVGYLEAGVPVIDSGLLGWWYHHGIIGVSAFLLLLVFVVRYGLGILSNREMFYSEPFKWPLVVGTTAYTLTIPVMWIMLPVPRYRRAFTLYLICIIFLVSICREHTSNR